MARAVVVWAVWMAAICCTSRAAFVWVAFDSAGPGRHVEWKQYTGTARTGVVSFVGLPVTIRESWAGGSADWAVSEESFRCAESGPACPGLDQLAGSFLSAPPGNNADASWFRATSRPSQLNRGLVGPSTTTVAQAVLVPGPLAMLAGLGMVLTVVGVRRRHDDR